MKDGDKLVETKLFCCVKCGLLKVGEKTVRITPNYVELSASAEPSPPSSGGRLFVKSDDKLYFKDSSGNVYSISDPNVTIVGNEGELITVANNEDISGGKTATLKNFKRWTLYLKVAAAMDITIELSPDGGTTWYEAPESPVSFSAAGDDIIEMGYDATHIRITGSTTDAVTAQIRGVY